MRLALLHFAAWIMLSPSARAADRHEGAFASPHDIAMMGYDKDECRKNGARWEDETCVARVSDVVTVTRVAGGRFKISVGTVTSNAHTCDYEELGALTGDGRRIVARTDVTTTRDDRPVKAVCRVTVTYLDRSVVSVTNNGNCAGYCGVNAELVVGRAIRQR